MNIQIQENAQVPAYLQLYESLVADITSGVYPCGSKLPSKRTIAAETGVSLITVEHAMELLDEEGYIECRPRSGYFVIYRASDFGLPANAGGTLARGRQDLFSYNKALGDIDSVNMDSYSMDSYSRASHKMGKLADQACDRCKESSNQKMACHEDDEEASRNQPHATYEFPFPTLAKTMRRVLLDYGEEILTRSPGTGALVLRQEISAYLARSRGIFAEPGQIVIGSGAEYLYGIIAQLLGDRSFAVEDPCYAKIRQVYEAMGVAVLPLPLTDTGIASQDLRATSASVLHVTPFHSYPSGISIDISKKQEYLDWAAARDGILIEDNYDSELTVSSKPEDSLYAIDRAGSVIYLNTFSHTIAPSMRIGYMVLPPRLVSLYEEKLGFYACTVPLFDQYVIADLLRSGDFERHVNRVRRAKRRALTH